MRIYNSFMKSLFFSKQIIKVKFMTVGFLFNNYYTGVLGRVLLHSLVCSTLP